MTTERNKAKSIVWRMRKAVKTTDARISGSVYSVMCLNNDRGDALCEQGTFKDFVRLNITDIRVRTLSMNEKTHRQLSSVILLRPSVHQVRVP